MNNNTYVIAQEGLNSFITKVFAWMFCGLMFTAATAFGTAVVMTLNPAFAVAMLNPFTLLVLFLVEIGLVIALSRSLSKISASSARAMFIVYSIVNGLTLSFIFLFYSGAVIGQAFVYAAVFFGVMAVYGRFTKTDLTSVGRILLIGLISIIIASLVNMFMESDGLDFLICIAGVGIFAGLTAFDMQRIKNDYYVAAQAGGEMAAKLSIMGALRLYLDFINLFLYIIRILARRR